MSVPAGADRYAGRLLAVQARLAEVGGDVLLVGVGPELEWLTGYVAHGHERLNLLVVPADGPLGYISPRLEAPAAALAAGLAGDTVRLWTWDETDDPFELVPRLLGALTHPRALVSDGLRAAFVLGLQAVLPGSSWGLASSVLGPLRQVKDASEVDLLRAAAAAADRAMARILGGPLVGRREVDVAREVRDALVEEGHDSAEFAIVASGPNSASPHHEPGGRVIRPGEPLLLDIGGRRAGYCSDVTRTVWIAGDTQADPDPEFRVIYLVTAAAQAAARAAVRPGVPCEALDAVARDVITAAGHGEHFIHRLGHGIGLEVHEEPYLVAGNHQRLRAGNTFSCEPGIYLAGRFGVRIEDIVLCAPDGGESLNTFPRELTVVSGR